MKGMRAGLVVAVVTAVAMMAFGAGSAAASPTVLCESNPTPSSCSHAYPSGKTFSVTGEFGLSSLTGCEFTYKFTTTAASGSPLPAKITSFTLTHCGTGWTVEAVNLHWEYQLLATVPEPDGLGKILGAELPPGFKVTGPPETGCIYTATVIPQTISGGGFIVSSNVTLTHTAGTGTGCLSSTLLSMGGFSTPEFWVTT